MRDIRRVLIANRGEIALRIARACHVMGLEPVGIHSEADATLAHLPLMDSTLCIGPAAASRSYLDGARILRAAALLKVDAIHPGYGFLSENADFAQAVEEAGLVLIGPSSTIMRRLGDKIQARQDMAAAGLPCLAGSDGALPDDPVAAARLCEQIGYPLIIKASGGGGGRGMRIVSHVDDLTGAIASAREEAIRAFHNPDLYAERFLRAARHIEIQILSDQHGHAAWIGARDCSVQRRHQKLIEEAPVPGIPRDRIAEIGTLCAQACAKIGYTGAGTVEFLYEDGSFHFIEMNTRLQVEHPVTEMTTGLDIVCEQLSIAMGRPLSFRQDDIRTTGHAIECRINAEHPVNFHPSPGTVTSWHPPGGPGVRVDSHLYTGYVVPPDYDSLVAKLIVHGADRADAIKRMRAALDEIRVAGIETNIALHRRLLDEPGFTAGGVDTGYLTTLLEHFHRNPVR
ncbi:MAG: acetyl-CoA carboxylase biotin carboxylase subunit [Gluconacetobacter sp.]|uniref:biotin carboxylase n=1 Tax=Gluconacetobacter dulcium TaxID=2729096 RepID=A0A7W4JXP8_9PROT|nr:acetyl-CoA carboxylase biotin carboxylase subunit [Gluconacetobacter dulcium]MBB2196640.1 acetyl-CoA carboxylase biotin carboxylase subunit [Gluconacetobacter dulcium]